MSTPRMWHRAGSLPILPAPPLPRPEVTAIISRRADAWGPARAHAQEAGGHRPDGASIPPRCDTPGGQAVSVNAFWGPVHKQSSDRSPGNIPEQFLELRNTARQRRGNLCLLARLPRPKFSISSRGQLLGNWASVWGDKLA